MSIEKRRRGQAIVEMAIVVVMLVFLVMGIAEVAYAFMRTNMIVNAARDGARFGATLPKTERNADGCFTGGTAIVQGHVQTSLDAIGWTADNINVVQDCVNAVPTIEVQVVGQLPLLFSDWFSSFTNGEVPVSRTVTFEDEGRTKCTC